MLHDNPSRNVSPMKVPVKITIFTYKKVKFNKSQTLRDENLRDFSKKYLCTLYMFKLSEHIIYKYLRSRS